MSPEASSEAGQWLTSRAEYQRGIMDAISDPSIETVVIMSSAQVGKTEIILNCIGYFMDQDPAPMLVVQPTLQMAEAFSKDRLSNMLRDTPALQGTVKDPRARDSGNTLLHKTFPGGHITMAGANSPASLASRPIRIVFNDEVDRYPPSAGAEGDPVALAYKRTTTFWNRKQVLVSTPTISGISRIEAAYLESDQRQYYVPCPECDHVQTLKWKQVKWEDDDPATAVYECENCQAPWSDAIRWRAIRQGEWVAESPFQGAAGFRLNELYSPWQKLEATVKSFLEAKAYPERLKTWINTTLGETWVEQGEAPDWERLYERSGDYTNGQVPADGLFLTAGVDVQKNRIEAEIVAWGLNKQSWSVDFIVFEGDPAKPQVWQKLSALMDKSFVHECGSALPISMLAIDSGYATQEVYAWCRKFPLSKAMAIKGSDRLIVPLGAPSKVDVTLRGRKLKSGARVWPVGVSVLKSELYSWLNLTVDEDGNTPPGYCHFPKYDPEYFKQLTAEQLVTKQVKGYPKREWRKIRDRNEALDCRVYARAAAIALGMDRWTDKKWESLLRDMAEPVPTAEEPEKKPKKRKVIKSQWMT